MLAQMWMHVFSLIKFRSELDNSQLHFVALINTVGFYPHTVRAGRSKQSSWTNFVNVGSC